MKRSFVFGGLVPSSWSPKSDCFNHGFETSIRIFKKPWMLRFGSDSMICLGSIETTRFSLTLRVVWECHWSLMRWLLRGLWSICTDVDWCAPFQAAARLAYAWGCCSISVSPSLGIFQAWGWQIWISILLWSPINSVHWASGRSRSSYLSIGDMIAFDVIYLTNNLNLSFDPFTGVNHHKLSTLFSCVLLADWGIRYICVTFHPWLKCMHEVAPKSTITDEDVQVEGAISKSFPNTRHHINKHIAKKEVLFKNQYGDKFFKHCKQFVSS